MKSSKTELPKNSALFSRISSYIRSVYRKLLVIIAIAGILICIGTIILIPQADKISQGSILVIVVLVLFIFGPSSIAFGLSSAIVGSMLNNTPIPGDIELVSVSNHIVEPGERFRPSVTVKVKNEELRKDRGDVLRCIDSNCDSDSIVRFGALPHVEVKGITRADQTYTFTFPRMAQ